MTTHKPIIYIFGNPLLDFDNLPIKLIPDLQKEFPQINFIIQDPNENLQPDSEGGLIIIDTVIGIDEIKIIHDINKIQQDHIYSMHDFDLGFNLKILKKIGKIKQICIIGVPSNINEKKAKRDLTNILKCAILGL